MFSEPFVEPSGTSDMPPGLEASRPTLGQRATEVGIGAAQGAARDTPVVAGAVTGLRLGMPMAAAAVPFIGPYAGIIPLATTAMGAGAGMMFGNELDRWFPAVDREDLVPYREGGKTFGSAIATAPAAFGLPVMTGNRVSKFVSAFGEMARRNPVAFMGTEAVTAGTMGVAGGASESFFPGQQGVRLGAELSAGVLTPTKLLVSGLDMVKGGLKSMKSSYANRSNSLELKSANILLDALEKSGEDPVALAKALRLQIPGSVPTPTSGQKTGSQALMDLESSLGAHHAQFGGETRQQAVNSMRAYQALIDNLQKIGNPEALKMAAQLRQQNFDNMLNTRLSAADATAAQKIAAISKDTPAARAEIGDIVKFETELALIQARAYEKELWTAAIGDMTKPVAVNKRTKTEMQGWQAQDIFDRTGIWPTVTFNETVLKAPVIRPQATVDAFLNRAAGVGELLYDDAIPASVRKVMEGLGVSKDAVQRFKAGKSTQEFLDTKQVPYGFKPNPSEIGVDELVNYRSTLLKMAREAGSRGEAGNAEFYGSLAEGMLDDLNTLKNPLFDQARQYSKSLNDVFTRTFAKDASITGSTTRAGAERLAPELLVTRAFGANADVTSLRMEQIEDAVKFGRTQYEEAVAKFGKNSQQAKYLKPMAELSDTNVVSIQDAQNRVLRLLANEAVTTVYDQAKGTYVQKLNTAKLTKFAQQNAPMLEKLGIMDDLRDAAHASNLLTQVANQNSAINKAVKNQTAFAQVLSVENPSRAINDALTSKFPIKNITNMSKLAKAGGSDSVDGMKSALYDYAYTKAGGNSGKFNIQAYEDALFKPIAQNQPSMVNIMRSSGLMSFTEVKDLRRLINPMVRIETAVKNNIPLDDVIQGADAVTELALRVVGARIGTAAAPGGPGSLIAASAGSKAVRQIFDNLPNATVRQILENAVKDPQAMAILLDKGRTDKQKIDIANRLLNYLGSIGVSVGKTAVTPALNYLAPEEPRPVQLEAAPQPPFTPQGQAARQLRQLPKAPNTRGVLGLLDTAPKPPGQAGDSGAPTKANASARAQYQSLFPFDSVSPMVGGSLQPQK
jgi:superoxide dismutase